ncbi:alpha/beta hydrolase [Pseudonocardia spinosispora]|uniref:poly(ethylene terephthalate) hydrolase family protein n=1 Tax=Pseudonocardia spinosispora TaxID=103441 RepID=UPI00055FE80C|nr:alpha/beta hydrolase [Pseudonocardia spinosispora]
MVRIRLLVCAVVGALLGLATPAVASASSANPIEAHFMADGPSGVGTDRVTVRGGGEYQLFFPADLDDGRHPIVTWGNGTDAVPDQYSGLLRHLASWGFVVIASTSKNTGTGAEILAGARYLVERDGDPGSRFHDRLDTDHIAAVGHSQGAGGSVNAAVRSGGLIGTTVPIALPNQLVDVIAGDKMYDVTKLTGTVFYLGGAGDVLIAPPIALRGYYDATRVPAALAVLRNADHNTVQGTGGRFLGYLTAWLRFQLTDDRYAAGAFTGTSPEITANPAWQDQALKGLERGRD